VSATGASVTGSGSISSAFESSTVPRKNAAATATINAAKGVANRYENGGRAI
jgi:hypothetical protein